MTISSVTNRNDYVGTGALNTYSYSFKIFLNTHLEVTVRDLAGAETPLVLTTDYTVTGVGETAGGTIVLADSGQSWLTAGNLTTGYTLTIRRKMPLTQLTDIRNQGDFFPESHEEQFDKNVMIAQEQDEQLGRSLRLPVSEVGSDPATAWPILTDRTSKFLAFDASGNPIASSGGISPSIPVSSFMETVLDDTSAAAARTTLDAISLSTAETISGEKTFSSNVTLSQTLSGDVELFVTNLSANVAAGARIQISAEAGGYDPRMSFALGGGGDDWSIGIDNSDSDSFKIARDQTELSTNTALRIDNIGAINKPLQPSFLAVDSAGQANVTGDGTNHTMTFNTEIYDQNADFDGVSTFTAPVTGRYLFCATVFLKGFTASHSSMNIKIVTSNRTYIQTRGDIDTATNKGLSISVIADMDALDTAVVQVQVGGDTLVVDTDNSASQVFFSGCLLA